MNAAGDRALARNVRLVAAARFLFWTHFVSAILVPFFRDWGGLDLAQILFLNAWFMGCGFALEVPTGAVADRFGRKASVALGYGVGVVATLAFVATPRFEAFLAAELLLALSAALVSGAEEALVYDSLAATGRTHEATRVLARCESWKLAGIVAGALGGSALVGVAGLRGTAALQAAPAALAALCALALREAPHPAGAPAHPSWTRIVREGVGHVAATPALRRLAVDLAAVNALAWLILWLYQPLLEGAGVPLAAFGSVHVALTLAQIALLSQVGALQSAVGSRRRLLAAFAFAAGVAFAGLGVARSAWAVVPLCVVTAGFGLARAPLMGADLNRHIPSERRATALSAVSMLRTLAIVLGNAAGALGARASVRGTALAAGLAIVALSLTSRVRDEDVS